MALVVDEAITVTEDERGRKALGDLARRGRHFGIERHVLTQRPTDWFGTKIGADDSGHGRERLVRPERDRELVVALPQPNYARFFGKAIVSRWPCGGAESS
jgi:hypothetical protein